MSHQIKFSDQCLFCKKYGHCSIPHEVNDLVQSKLEDLSMEINNRNIDIFNFEINMNFYCGHFVPLFSVKKEDVEGPGEAPPE